jgi:hypothetical protein
MNPLRSRLATAGLVGAGGVLVVVTVVVLPILLGAIANAMWAFAMTPGGIVAIVLLWKWLSLQEARARRKKRS